jgi:hypothetical protein
VNNGADTVTVDTAFPVSGSGITWAIGGKRATLAGTNSKKLFDNNSAAGDVAAGWTVELESGHTETITATFDLRRNGDATNGPVTLRGAVGAATRPVITFSNNSACFQPRGSFGSIENLDLVNTNATKTASTGVLLQSTANVFRIQNMRIGHATNKFWKGINISAQTAAVYDTLVLSCANTGIEISQAAMVRNCAVLSGGGSGIVPSVAGVQIIGNLIAYNATDGVNNTLASASVAQPSSYIHNTFHGNGSDGLELTATPTNHRVFDNLEISSNIFSQNGAYGINCSGAGVTAQSLAAAQVMFLANTFYGNVTGKYLPTDLQSLTETTTDPSGGLSSASTDYTGASGGTDFTIVSALKGLGYPGSGRVVGSNSSTVSYADPGVAQRQEPAGGGGGGLKLAGRGGLAG